MATQELRKRANWQTISGAKALKIDFEKITYLNFLFFENTNLHFPRNIFVFLYP